MDATIVRSAIFGVRNVNKTKNGQIGRSTVAVGQAKKVVDYVKTLDNTLGKSARTASQALTKAAKSEHLWNVAGKAVNFASEHINPLICVSAGIDVLMAEDKEEALVTNTAALASMFTVEKLMKKHLDEVTKIKGIDKIAQKIVKFAKTHKYAGKLPAIIQGAAFVAGSITAYNIGEKFGKLLLGKKSTEEVSTQGA